MKKTSITIELDDQELAHFERIATRERRTVENLLLYWADTLIRQEQEFEERSENAEKAYVSDFIRNERVE